MRLVLELTKIQLQQNPYETSWRKFLWVKIASTQPIKSIFICWTSPELKFALHGRIKKDKLQKTKYIKKITDKSFVSEIYNKIESLVKSINKPIQFTSSLLLLLNSQASWFTHITWMRYPVNIIISQLYDNYYII